MFFFSFFYIYIYILYFSFIFFFIFIYIYIFYFYFFYCLMFEILSHQHRIYLHKKTTRSSDGRFLDYYYGRRDWCNREDGSLPSLMDCFHQQQSVLYVNVSDGFGDFLGSYRD